MRRSLHGESPDSGAASPITPDEVGWSGSGVAIRRPDGKFMPRAGFVDSNGQHTNFLFDSQEALEAYFAKEEAHKLKMRGDEVLAENMKKLGWKVAE